MKTAHLQIVRVLLIFFEVILGISAATHWVVTENGRIQPQMDSLFDIRRPYDLISFLEQEKRREHSDRLYKQMIARKASIDRQWTGLDTAADIENRIYSSDQDCLLAGKPFVDIDLYASVATDGSYRKGVSPKDYLLDGIPSDGRKTVPDCKTTFPLDFSMYTFEHLNAMRNRVNLTQHQEKGLIKYLPPGTDLNKFGHQIAHGLLRNQTSWLHLNLAAIYWRVRGDSYNALECGRRAIVAAPRQFRDIPLLTTGGILHAAKYSAEAAIILHTAIDYAPSQSHQHLALGHVYASLGDYNRSIACYDNSLKLTPTMDQARDAKHAILCHQKLENTLTSLLQQLQNILSELYTYQNEQEEWFKLQERMLWEKAHSPIINMHKNFEEEAFSKRGQSCMKRGGDESVLTCDLVTDRQALVNNLQIDISVSLQLLSSVENQVKKINEQMIKSKIVHGSKDQVSKTIEYIEEKGSKFFSVFMEPTDRPKYYNLKIIKSSEDFEAANWPEKAQCESYLLFLEDEKNYVPIYLPPENKGYATHLFLSELIGLEQGKEHVLPWHSPTCYTAKNFDEKYIPKSLLKATASFNKPDSSLSPLLTSLVEDAEMDEIGQRILTATKSNVAAYWVLSMLASLYWRVVGKPRNALDCLQLALNSVPNRFKDVPLISIASISQKVNLIDNALAVTEEALSVNPVEPMSNFLYGSLLYMKGNNTGAIYYLKQTLRVDLHLMNDRALNMLRFVACQEKFDTSREAS